MIDLTPIFNFEQVVIRAKTIQELSDLVRACDKEGFLWCASEVVDDAAIVSFWDCSYPGLYINNRNHSYMFVKQSFTCAHEFHVSMLIGSNSLADKIKAEDVLGILDA